MPVYFSPAHCAQSPPSAPATCSLTISKGLRRSIVSSRLDVCKQPRHDYTMTASPHTQAQPQTTQLSITLLGTPQLTVPGAPEPILLPRRQLRALLYRLAVALQPVSREQLCFLLWPDI